MKKLLAALLVLASPAFAGDYQALVKATMPKVVTIYVEGIGTPEQTLSEKLTGITPLERPMGFIGSGSIISSDGLILTCDHLFTKHLKNRVVSVELSDGYRSRGIIIAEDKPVDLALVKVFMLRKTPYFTFGKPVCKGQPVVSFGSPLGWRQHVSFGYVENLGIKDRDRPRTVHGASINPGNSGGPLVDETGHIVGVNIESMGGMEALHLAVTLHDIRKFLGV